MTPNEGDPSANSLPPLVRRQVSYAVRRHCVSFTVVLNACGMRCDLDVQIRSIKVHRPLQNSRTPLCGTNSVILSPPISIIVLVRADKVQCVAAVANGMCCEFHDSVLTAYGQSPLYSPHPVVASRRGPRTNILLSRTQQHGEGI